MQALPGTPKGIVVNVRDLKHVHRMVTVVNSKTQRKDVGGDIFSSLPSTTPESDLLAKGFDDG